MDEALLHALVDLRNKFRCNGVSGCPAHDILVGFRRHAWKPLRELFPLAPAKAPYRSRIVRIVAELELDEARPWLRKLLVDDSDKARGFAVYGLALLGDSRDLTMLRQFADAPGIIASAMTRTAAAWGLAIAGHDRGPKRFAAILKEAAEHQLGGATLRWGLELCQRPGSPSCDGILATAAGHPSYIVRRQVLRNVGAPWTDGELQALGVLVADPNPNLARRARAQLQRIKGGQALDSPSAWRQWLKSKETNPDKRAP